MMKNILVINGHEYYDVAKGQLNQTLFNHIIATLQPHYNIRTTIIQSGYDIKEEQEKYKWSDIVIIQFPIYWMDVPGALKTYFDKVYEHDVFFKGSDIYGHGGLMTGKQFMFSTTWNAPKNSFKDGQFFNNRTPEDILTGLYFTHQFIGMKPLPGFSVHDVIKNPKIDEFLHALDTHLARTFIR